MSSSPHFIGAVEIGTSKVCAVVGDMSPEEFRRFGHEVVDWIAGYLSRTEDYPVLAQVELGEDSRRKERRHELVDDVDGDVVGRDEGEQQERQEQANHGEVAAVLWCAGGAARIAPRGTVVLAHGHLHSRGFVVNREPIQQ